MNKKLFFLVSLFLITSCKISIEKDFNDFCFPHSQNEQILYSYGLDNDSYKRLINTNENINSFLLKQASSIEKTDWKTEFFLRPLTVGDLAIVILMNKNNFSDENFDYFIPASLKPKFDEIGITAWWDWIHESEENRDFVIEQLELLISE